MSGIHVAIREGGQRPVLLLHGGGCGGWMWSPLVAELDPGIRLLTPDLPGHDRSGSLPYRSHDDALKLLISLIDAEASEPVVVVGFSLGAQLAIPLASRRPDLVRAVVVISAQAEPSPFPAPLLSMLGLAAPLARNEGFARLQAKELFVPEALTHDYLRTSRGITRATLLASVGENVRFTIPGEWGAFPGRSLILVGAKERPVMRRSAQRIADALPGSELEIVADCGHGIPLQKPAWLARRLDGLLE